MSTLVRQMTYTAMIEQVGCLGEELLAAALAGDMKRVSRLDHALRSAVIALVAGAPLTDDDTAAERLKATTEALATVKQTVAILARQAGKDTKQQQGNLLYLRFDRKGGVQK